MKSFKPILLIEDNPVDVMTIKRASAELKITEKLVHVTNGVEALNYLKNSSNRQPCVILLDLNTPKMDGVEFLKTIKADESLREIPVVVLTGSLQEQSVIESFSLGAAGYIIKPASYEQFVEKLKAIDIYWSFSELPSVK